MRLPKILKPMHSATHPGNSVTWHGFFRLKPDRTVGPICVLSGHSDGAVQKNVKRHGYIRSSDFNITSAAALWTDMRFCMVCIMKLEDIMSRDYETINEDATIFEAVQMMTRNKVYGIIVANSEGHPVGLLSERSLVKRFILRNKKPDEVPVKAVMRRPLPSVPHNLSLPKVAEYLVRNGLERTTVTNNGKVVGYVTVTDMAGHLSRNLVGNILSSHRLSEFIYFCPKCGSGQLKPVHGEKGEIKVFSCNNDRCDYQE